MSIPNEYSFQRYLAAKKSVDDRALNRYVWQTLQAQMANHPNQTVHILELGAGIGTMVERIREWGLTERRVQYRGIDTEARNIEAAQERITQTEEFKVKFETLNLFDLLKSECDQSDIVIAHAFLDLIDLRQWLKPILRLVKPDGLFYFTINFDGLTILEPELDYSVEVMQLYHQTMDQRIVDGQASGDSRTGRHLFRWLREAGASVLAAGSSDWVVHPSYIQDEAYFLHFLVHTIDSALREHPEIDAVRFAAWIAERHAQIERGELVYVAHQLDILGTVCTL